MTDAVRVEYACLDGSPFPVTFADRSAAELRWVIDLEHAPIAMTPLADSVRGEGRAGTELAHAESGLPMPSTFSRERPQANGYDYFVDQWLPEADREAFDRGLRRLVDKHGGTWEVWIEHSLPRVQEACAWLQRASPDETFRSLAERRAYAWSHTGVAGVLASGDLRAVAACCEGLYGDRATLVAYELAQGSENETIDADAALWQLARMAPGAADTDAALEEFLAAYGARSTSWSIDHPTTLERPDLVQAQIDLLRRHGHRDVESVRLQAAARQRDLVEGIRARLAGEERARFDRRLARLEAFVPVREARARWQLVASGALRRAVLARGRVLVDRGVLDDAADVFFLTPEEYDDPVGPLRDAVAARRADHAHWTAVTPPFVIGDTTGGDAGGSSDGLIRGEPGGAGVARGPARVILDLLEVERLQPGDILVTTMTSPPWTPLFGIAAGVVTDSGDVLSHVAIAAREYGIPCVVGTHHATALIPDGAPVTVDGDAGTVQVGAG